MLKQDTYLINIASAPFKLSNLKQPIYYKLRSKIIANYGSFIAHHDNPNYKLLQDYYKLLQDYYKLLQDYYKLRQKFITNYGSFITNYGKYLLQITAKNYYKLRQFLFL